MEHPRNLMAAIGLWTVVSTAYQAAVEISPAVRQSLSIAIENAREHPHITAFAVGLSAAVVVKPLALYGLSSVGFGAAGVKAQTAASWWQSNYGVNWMFSLMQSSGATSSLGDARLLIGIAAGWMTAQMLASDHDKTDVESLQSLDGDSGLKSML